MLDPEFLALLACPKCHADLRETEDGLECRGKACGLIFKVEDGIPNLLIEEALPPKRQPDSTEGRKKGDS